MSRLGPDTKEADGVLMGADVGVDVCEVDAMDVEMGDVK